MLRRFVPLAALLFLALTALSACGDGADDGTPGPSPARSSGTPAIPADFGPAPTLGKNIESITPAHGARVQQASTRTLDPIQPRGLCATVNFEPPVENLQWFRMVIDDREVTPELTIRADAGTPPKGATLCWPPPQGLSVGKHTAALSVGPFGGTPIQVIGWAFEVVE